MDSLQSRASTGNFANFSALFVLQATIAAVEAWERGKVGLP